MSNQQNTPTVSKSQLFTHYNKARARATGYDRCRVNRALGLVQAGKVHMASDGTITAGANGEQYAVTPYTCTCPDFAYRNSRASRITACKHMIARSLYLESSPELGIIQRLNDAPEPLSFEQAVADLWGF